MSKQTAEKQATDKGFTVRIPSETLRELREIAAKVKRGPLQTEAEVLTVLARRALSIGTKSKDLVPKA